MIKKEKLEIIRKFYPNAVTTVDSVNKLVDYVEDELELEPTKVMHADSICGDDINNIQYPTRAHEFLGPFNMGGLNGYPFTGKTGMKAFASHVPDEGAVFIYYGPHIGITKFGELGEVQRMGQKEETHCCGAAKGALDKLKNNEIVPGEIKDDDYQMNVIEQIFLKQKDRILQAEHPIYEATEVMYEAIDERINYLVDNTPFHCKYVILLGAILINSDSDMGSYTTARRFDVINVCEKKKRSMMDYFL